MLKTQVITITYMPSSIPCFQEIFRGALKACESLPQQSQLEIREANSVYSLQPSVCWYFCWYRGATFMANSLFQHRKATRQAQQVAARPFKQWADEWLAKKKVEKVNAEGSSRCATPRH